MKTCDQCVYAGPRRNYEDHECRRRAPVGERVDHWQDLRLWAPRWPIVKAKDWCGEFVDAPLTPPDEA